MNKNLRYLLLNDYKLDLQLLDSVLLGQAIPY